MSERIYNVLFLCMGNSARSILAVGIVCDSAVGEARPVWSGQPLTGHWGIEDPATVEGSELTRRAVFVTAMRYMKNRISVFTALPIDRLECSSLHAKVRAIGQFEGTTSPRFDVA